MYNRNHCLIYEIMELWALKYFSRLFFVTSLSFIHFGWLDLLKTLHKDTSGTHSYWKHLRLVFIIGPIFFLAFFVAFKFHFFF